MPTHLTSIAPLIQLWAGICAICFYDNLVKHMMVAKERKKLGKNLMNIKEQLHGLLDDRCQEWMTEKIDERLYNFRKRITHIGKLTCGLTIGLLAIAGLEQQCNYCYWWLMVPVVAFAIYVAVIAEHKSLRYYKHPWSFSLPLLAGWIILACGFISLPDPGFTFTEIHNLGWCLLCIISFILIPIVYFAATYYIEQRMAKFQYLEMEKLSADFQKVGEYYSMGISYNPSPEDLPWLADIFRNGDRTKQRERYERYERHVLDCLNDIFAHGSIWRYKFRMRRRKVQYHISTYCRNHKANKMLPYPTEIEAFKQRNSTSLFWLSILLPICIMYIIILTAAILNR